MALKYLLLAAALALAPLAAHAQSTYRCVSKDGKKYYGSTIPQQCLGQPLEVLSPQGTVIRRIDPEGDEKARAAKEAEALKKRDEDTVTKEEARRNRALLATYTSAKDIDDARARALQENDKAIKDIERRVDDIKKRQAGHEKEMEFYREGAAKPSADKKAKSVNPPEARSGPKPPPKLVEDMRNSEVDLRAQEELLAVKKKEVEMINARYNEDKKRFIELTKRGK